jgi:ABC-type multidrug transport system ATPase subunit
MNVKCDKLSKNYGFQRIVKDVDITFGAQTVTGIGGRNGSGKSTLLKMISGYLSPTSGSISYKIRESSISRNDLFRHLSFSAPYIELTPSLTLQETFNHYKSFKPTKDLSYEAFVDYCEFTDTKAKQISAFSSGMKQKINLALALISDLSLLIFDEPTSYLDDEAKKWFYDHLETSLTNKTIIIASNDNDDFGLVSKKYKIEQGILV